MSSPTGGVKPFSIQGRLYRERERLDGMSEVERNWRKQWIRDQNLSPNEPRVVPELYKELYNPIRRAYMMPLNVAFKALEPVMGKEFAGTARAITGKMLMGFAALYLGAYLIKYNPHDWTRKGGWRLVESRKESLPGDPDFSAPRRTTGAEYSDRNFKNSPI